MKISKISRVLIVIAAAASLSACGGGGGGGGGGSSATPPTQPANTGLSDPGLNLTQSVSAAIPLVQEMTLTYGLADEAQATKALGSLVPGVGNTTPSPYQCAGGGTITYTPNATGLAYTYTGCSDGTYTFTGTSQVTPTVNAGGALTNYQISFTGLQQNGPSGSATVTGSLACIPAATAGQQPSCVTQTTVAGASGEYVWGYDISYAANTANGSHQCDCGQGSWNVTFKNFTATNGVAEVFATNGSAIVTRTGAKTFTVVMFVGGTVQTYDVTLP
jgi:hypothetical protein